MTKFPLIKNLPDINSRCIVLDTETTGLFTDNNHIIEIAAVEIKNGFLTGNQFHAYLKPRKFIEPSAQQKHNMNNIYYKEFFEGVYESDKVIMENFLIFVGSSLIFAHNATFDSQFINHELKYWNLPEIPEDNFRCSMRIFRNLFDNQIFKKEIKGNSLSSCAEFFHLKFDDKKLHSALYDASLTAKLINSIYFFLIYNPEYLSRRKITNISYLNENKQIFGKKNNYSFLNQGKEEYKGNKNLQINSQKINLKDNENNLEINSKENNIYTESNIIQNEINLNENYLEKKKYQNKNPLNLETVNNYDNNINEIKIYQQENLQNIQNQEVFNNPNKITKEKDEDMNFYKKIYDDINFDDISKIERNSNYNQDSLLYNESIIKHNSCLNNLNYEINSKCDLDNNFQNNLANQNYYIPKNINKNELEIKDKKNNINNILDDEMLFFEKNADMIYDFLDNNEINNFVEIKKK